MNTTPMLQTMKTRKRRRRKKKEEKIIEDEHKHEEKNQRYEEGNEKKKKMVNYDVCLAKVNPSSMTKCYRFNRNHE